MQLCALCQSEVVVTEDNHVACTSCGAIDERATSVRNTAQVSAAFGTLLHDDDRTSLAKAQKERLHEEAVSHILDLYLVDGRSRITNLPAGHFKAGARQWYNRIRAEEDVRRELVNGMTTNNRAKKLPIRLALAIMFTIQDSNITLMDNRLQHLKKRTVPPSEIRGDGGTMAPTLDVIFMRTSALDPDHPGYIGSKRALRVAHTRFCKTFKRRHRPIDLVLSQALVMGNYLERLAKMSWSDRLERMSYQEVSPVWLRKGITIETAGENHFQLDSAAWKFISDVDWQKTLEAAFKLYSATAAVRLWGDQSATDIATALLFWAIAAATEGGVVPHITAWTAELSQTFGGNERNALARRAELSKMLVAWSTSIPDIGLPIPLIAGPSRGKAVGDGLVGFAGDKTRGIPERQMAAAAVPVIAEHWRDIVKARCKRPDVILFSNEYAMAQKMFARKWYDIHPPRRSNQVGSQLAPPMHSKPRKLSVADRKAKTALAKARAKRMGSTASSRATSERPPSESGMASTLASSGATSPAPPSEPVSIASWRSSVRPQTPDTLGRGASREEMERSILAPTPKPTPPASGQSIEELLALHEDSSADGDDGNGSQRDADGETEVEWEVNNPREWRGREAAPEGSRNWLSDREPRGHPFAFSVGPDGSFEVARDEASSTPVVRVSQKRPASNARPGPSKRPRNATGVPLTPPSTLSISAATSLRAVSESPSLRAVSMSPSASHTSLPIPPPDESEESRYDYLLCREREQYVAFNISKERDKGLAMPMEVEAAMDAWVADAIAKGRMPAITDRYLASLNIRGDPRSYNLEPFIRRHAEQWSPTECLLRLGIKPREFPVNRLVYSLISLHLQLGTLRPNLAPEGAAINEKQLEHELDVLFKHDGAPWRALILSDAEAGQREQAYLQAGVWSYGRTIPEGRTNRLDGDQAALERLQKRSKSRRTTASLDSDPDVTARGSSRINYDAIRRLAYLDDKGEAADEDDDEDEDEALNDAKAPDEAEDLASDLCGHWALGGALKTADESRLDKYDEDESDDESGYGMDWTSTVS
jgi:hypothetical protein